MQHSNVELNEFNKHIITAVFKRACIKDCNSLSFITMFIKNSPLDESHAHELMPHYTSNYCIQIFYQGWKFNTASGAKEKNHCSCGKRKVSGDDESQNVESPALLLTPFS